MFFIFCASIQWHFYLLFLTSERLDLIYYEEIKRELKRRPMYGCRWDEKNSVSVWPNRRRISCFGLLLQNSRIIEEVHRKLSDTQKTRQFWPIGSPPPLFFWPSGMDVWSHRYTSDAFSQTFPRRWHRHLAHFPMIAEPSLGVVSSRDRPSFSFPSQLHHGP